MTQLRPTGLVLAEHKRNIWHCIPEAGTPFEAVLNRGYWAHVSRNLSAGDRIEVFPPERSYFAELYVLGAGKLFADVKNLRHIPLQQADADISPLECGEYQARWLGLDLQWCIVRGDDRVKPNLSKDEAISFIEGIAKGKAKKVEPKAKAA